MTPAAHIRRALLSAIPDDPEPSIAKWGDANVKTFGARGVSFDSSKTPWIIEPMDRMGDGVTRKVTVVGAVQSAKSVITEVGVCYVLATESSGDVQWNFQDDEFADDRWDTRLRRILTKCEPVRRRWPSDRAQDRKGITVFPHCSLTVQGVFTRKNVASSSIRFQFNDEIHLWEAGRLMQAHNRTTAYWNSLIVNVSNASDKGDQLDFEFTSGTAQRFQWKCPGCKQWHVPRLKWEDTRPELGGLRYDADGCRLESGDYDYVKMKSSARFQMPCGFEVHEDLRRKLSMGGRYSAPVEGSDLAHRSFIYSAAVVDYIPMIDLIRQKHIAIKAMRHGDPGPFRVYVTERECEFWDAEDRPLLRAITVRRDLKKDRIGLPGRFARYFALDRQQGSLKAGELPHWWMVIRDVLPNGDSLLVWEGKCLTDDDAIGVIKEHGCMMRLGVADSGDDTTHVYQFCLRHGINAIKGAGELFFHHPDKAKRIFSVEKPLHSMINSPPIHAYQLRTVAGVMAWHPHIDEPMFWHYSNPGLLDRFHWLRSERSVVKWDVPEDVSEDYKKHMEAWQLDERRAGPRKELVSEWRQVARRDDLHKCEQYIVMLMEKAGLVGERVAAQ
jgi:hypothetical protein